MSKGIDRRTALAMLGKVGGAALVAPWACDPSSPGRTSTGETLTPGRQSSEQSQPMKEATHTSRMPTVFLPHGGGPWPFMDDRVFGTPGMWNEMRAYMEEDLRMVPPSTPEAILVISAHWEEVQPTVMTNNTPPMLYDYYGFPDETYEVQWPAPGAPEVAEKVQDLLQGAGFTTKADPSRGFDHGTFVPLKLTYPDANIPTFQLSLKAGLDPEEHVRMGRALEPLRDEGVFIVGSGMSYHNLKVLMRRGANRPPIDESVAFDDWLAESMDQEASKRETKLVEWERAPGARASHPREEHLLPLMVVAGAAGEDPGHLPYRDVVMGARVSAVHFG